MINLISLWKDNSVTPGKSTTDQRAGSGLKTEGPSLYLPFTKQTPQGRSSYDTHFADEETEGNFSRLLQEVTVRTWTQAVRLELVPSE